MKLIFLLILWILPSSLSVAGEVESEVAKKVAEESAKKYTEHQIKLRIASAVNKNHHLFGSSNEKLGSLGLKYISQALAVYNIIAAESDKQRAFGVAQLYFTGEPYSTMILLAVQIADTVVSINHQRDLMRIYDEIFGIYEKLSNVRKSIITDNVIHQQNILISMQKDLSSVDAYVELIERGISKINTQKELMEATNSLQQETTNLLSNIYLLERALMRFNEKVAEFKLVVDKEIFEITEDQVSYIENTKSEFLKLQKDLHKFREESLKLMSKVETEIINQSILEESNSHINRTQSFLICSRYLNQYLTNSSFDTSLHFIEQDFNFCGGDLIHPPLNQ